MIDTFTLWVMWSDDGVNHSDHFSGLSRVALKRYLDHFLSTRKVKSYEVYEWSAKTGNRLGGHGMSEYTR
jgi:hypothetical protein